MSLPRRSDSTPPLPASQLPHILLSAFLDAVPDRIYFKDLKGRFIAASRSKLLRHGFSELSELLGKTDFDIFPLKHAQRALEDEKEVLRTGKAIPKALESIVWPDGTETWTEVTKMPLRNNEGVIIGTFGISKDVTLERRMERKMEAMHKNLVESSRMAGMAEVATGVLHNVGNVLNSLNVSATILRQELRDLKVESIEKTAAILSNHTEDFASFLLSDPKGKLIVQFIPQFAAYLHTRRAHLLAETQVVLESVEHIKEIVSMQQAYATTSGAVESLNPATLLNDAVQISSQSLQRHQIVVDYDFEPVPNVLGERGKILQILINLIQNAKNACDDSKQVDKRIILRVKMAAEFRVHLIVEDNGTGIHPDNLVRIFQLGFTTRKSGHGFGLHSAANAAREMKGQIIVDSEGIGKGAKFVLVLPGVTPAPPQD